MAAMSDHFPQKQQAGRVVAALKPCVCGAAATAILIGIWGLLVWTPAFKNVRVGMATLRPDAALAFLFSGLALCLRRAELAPLRTRRLADACSVAILLVGIVTLLQYALHQHFGIDRLPVDSMHGRSVALYPDRIAAISAILFLMMGMALLLLDVEDRRGYRPAQFLIFLVALFALAALIGYLFNALSLQNARPYNTIPLPAALTFILLSVGALCARPDRGSIRVLTGDAVGSEVARRLFPAAIVVPPLLCILSYLGYVVRWYEVSFGLALLTTLNSAVFAILIWRTAEALNDTDIQRRRTEIQRNELEAQLFQARKLESVGRLAGGVAHDFNNLLTAILGFAELLEMEIPIGSETAAWVLNIQQAAERAAGLTSQLLAFARRQVIEPKIVDLNGLILNLNTMLQRLIGEHIQLTMQAAADLYTVSVDPNQFEQILINLVVNARDAIPLEGGKITVETSNVVLDVEYARQHEGVTPGEYVLLVVSDTGSGMEEGIRLHIFEPFFTTKEKGRGTGLGLATVYGIVKQAGGHIWLYSEVGEGTSFKIYLPRATGRGEAVVTPGPSTAPLRGTETLLVVEDEVAVRALTTAALRGLGYHVLEAPDGPTALHIEAEYTGDIALLITDVVMPRMNGKELAERLQAARPTLKVLFVSGYTENTIVHHGVLDTGIVFLPKPFTLSALSHKVREVLNAA